MFGFVGALQDINDVLHFGKSIKKITSIVKIWSCLATNTDNNKC